MCGSHIQSRIAAKSGMPTSSTQPSTSFAYVGSAEPGRLVCAEIETHLRSHRPLEQESIALRWVVASRRSVHAKSRAAVFKPEIGARATAWMVEFAKPSGESGLPFRSPPHEC